MIYLRKLFHLRFLNKLLLLSNRVLCICRFSIYTLSFLEGINFELVPVFTLTTNFLELHFMQFPFTFQKVSLARRFALVPLGPPLLSYRSNCKAMLNAVDDSVQLVVDRPYKTGEPIVVWYDAFPAIINTSLSEKSLKFLF